MGSTTSPDVPLKKRFVGTGQVRTADDVKRVAARLDVDPNCIEAVIAVETDGRGFDRHDRPTILFEPHVFYRLLSGSERDEAVKQGLAYPNWGEKPYPDTSNGNYDRLTKACAINGSAALQAASWGLPQIMGENYLDVGYKSPADMVLMAMTGEAAQIEMLADFLIKSKLAAPLRSRDWATFARGYNGPGQVAEYSAKLARAYAAASDSAPETPSPKPETIQKSNPTRMPAEPPQQTADDLNAAELQKLAAGG